MTHLSARMILALFTLPVFIFSASCGSSPAHEPSIGTAFVGPATLNLRKDLATRSPGVIVVEHGQRLEILESRRRTVRVRTKDGAEGWADSSQLLSPQQMDNLERLATTAAKLPSQGVANVFDALNMHTAPNRTSPNFHQIPENGSVEVLAHRAAPRTSTAPRNNLVTVRPSAPKKIAAKSKSGAPALDLPPPPPPAPPAHWLELSRPHLSDLPGYQAPTAVAAAPLDDWNLVRTKDGKVGWVLARMLFMAVPDDVAQYAEGQRITSYMVIGDVDDAGEKKHNYLWTTAPGTLKTADFDSFRIFTWSAKRHRYETAHVERNLLGYYPVELVDVPGEKDQDAKGFALVIQEKDGTLARRVYGFSGFRVRQVSKTSVLRDMGETGQQVPVVLSEPSAPLATTWWQNLTRRARVWFTR